MRHHVCRHIAFVAALWLTAVVLAGCASDRVGCNYRAVVSIEPLRFFADRLAGPRWHVATIVPKGFSPEEFMPTVRQMADVSRACLLLEAGGLGFETTMLSDARQATEGLKVVDTSQGMERSAFDPHTWTSPACARIICRNITDALIETDPSNASDYEARLRATLVFIDSLDLRLNSVMQTLPSRSFVIAHPSLTRFATDYRLDQIAIESDGKEPTPDSLKRLIEQARQRGVRVVFVQPEFSESTAWVIASETGARIVSINPLAYDWDRQLLYIAKSLKDEQTNATSD